MSWRVLGLLLIFVAAALEVGGQVILKRGSGGLGMLRTARGRWHGAAAVVFFAGAAVVWTLGLQHLDVSIAQPAGTVALYRRRNPEIAVSARTGARLGAICGFFCAGMTAILGALRVAILHEGGKIRTVLLDALQQQSSRYPDADFQASLDFFRSPTGLVLMLVFFFIAALIILILLGMLGGALGGASLGRRDRN